MAVFSTQPARAVGVGSLNREHTMSTPSIQTRLQAALALQHAGQFAQAIDDYLDILSQHPDQHDAHHQLGVAYWNHGQQEVALTHLQRALQAPQVPGGYWLAVVDALTGLGNRLALDEALTAALSQHQMGVLMLVHLDRFRAINDLLGFAAGDLVLQVATTRLSELWPDDSRVHRLGGNVFALLVTGLPAYDSDSLHRQVFRALEGEPFTLADQQIDLTVTLGIVRFPQHGNQAGLLLRNAEVALYAAKQAHKPWSEYNAEQVGSRREQLSLLGELRRAVGDVLRDPFDRWPLCRFETRQEPQGCFHAGNPSVGLHESAKPLVIDGRGFGDQDIDPKHPALRRDAASDRQGITRFARGRKCGPPEPAGWSGADARALAAKARSAPNRLPKAIAPKPAPTGCASGAPVMGSIFSSLASL